MTTTHVFWAFAAATLLDIATTLYALMIGAREANPLLRALFGVVGPLPAMLITHSLVLALVWYERSYMTVLELTAVTGMWWGLVLWNFYQIWRQRRGS